MEVSKRYEVTVRMPNRLTGVKGLIAGLAIDYPSLQVQGEKEEEPFLHGRQYTFSFDQFTPLAEDGLRVRGAITVTAGDRERIPIKGEFDLNGQGWIERDPGRDP